MQRARQISRSIPWRASLDQLISVCREEFEYRWDDLVGAEYGPLRHEVLEAFDRYLNCGILRHGCARARCGKCSHSTLIAFSCKRLGLCPSCSAKRAVLFAEQLHSNHPQFHTSLHIPTMGAGTTHRRPLGLLTYAITCHPNPNICPPPPMRRLLQRELRLPQRHLHELRQLPQRGLRQNFQAKQQRQSFLLFYFLLLLVPGYFLYFFCCSAETVSADWRQYP